MRSIATLSLLLSVFAFGLAIVVHTWPSLWQVAVHYALAIALMLALMLLVHQELSKNRS